MNSTSLYDTNWTSILESTTEDPAAICQRVKPQQIVSLCFTFTAAIFLIYFVTALCVYSCKKKLMIGRRGTRISSSDQAVSVVNFVTVCGAVFVFVYVTIEIPLLVPPSQTFCNIYHRIKIISFAGAVFCAYFALWYRIFSAFYRNSIMKQSISKTLQILNVFTLVFEFLMVGSNLFLFLSAPAYTNMPCACRAVQTKESNLVKWAILVACTTAFEFTLLFTFIYPLHLHRKKMLNRQNDQRSIIPIVKRASVVAVICVASDLINSGFAIAYKGETVYINHIVYSCNLIVNLTGVVFTFANWREKLLPCRRKKYHTGTGSKTINSHSGGFSYIKATNV